MSVNQSAEAGPLALAGRLRGGAPVFAFWSVVPSPQMAEAIVRSGYGAVVLDAQHGLYDFAAIEQAVPAIATFGGSAIVRLPLGAIALGARALDVGAAAIIVPMVNTAEEARAVVAALKYPPVGGRSFGPLRGMAFSGLDRTSYVHRANHLTPVFVMIESETALRNLDQIAAVDGIDGLFVGPNDLAVSLTRGHATDPAHPLVTQAVEKVRLQCVRHGRIAGIYANTPELARDYVARGYALIAMGNEIAFASAGAAAALERAGG
ncbi:aldolase/citrate lyase family protein [Bosea sp. 117]|uniref:HpcH/HpaI aldolase family protein n=1 Tax=Bosea sp. 117 TaxID=1125973 RepID=UPI00068BD87B|nr:aldolase/citrate lyase family protein [Bosea sp. 117]